MPRHALSHLNRLRLSLTCPAYPMLVAEQAAMRTTLMSNKNRDNKRRWLPRLSHRPNPLGPDTPRPWPQPVVLPSFYWAPNHDREQHPESRPKHEKNGGDQGLQPHQGHRRAPHHAAPAAALAGHFWDRQRQGFFAVQQKGQGPAFGRPVLFTRPV